LNTVESIITGNQ